MGREERAGRESRKALRILEWADDPLDVRAFEVTFEAFSGYRPERDDEASAAALYEKLAAVGIEKKEQTANPDLVLRTLDGADAMTVTESERDLLLKAIAAIRWPVFALAKRDRAVEIIKEAAHPAPETAAPPLAAEGGVA